MPYLPFYFDNTMLLLIPGIILATVAQARVSRAFNQYSQIKSALGMTGAAAARRMLDENGLSSVQIRQATGRLSDHYDPRTRTLNLSESVYHSQSLAALGVAAHEVGHAVQHSEKYAPMALRSALVPAANIGSYAAWPLLILGLILSIQPLVYAGVAVFGLAVLFQLVTLPVEFNASRRALAMLERGYLSDEEITGARRVLSAAALTYLAATLMAILQLLRLLLLANGGRRRD